MGENIGAAARAMKNFSLSDLRIVNPRDGWPNAQAENMSVGARDVIDGAKLYKTLDEAIADMNYVYAATAQLRDMNKEYIYSHELADNLSELGTVGVLFGRESSGLSNQEIARANKIVTIETNDNFSSLNIAQAICVICYEVFRTDQNITAKLDNIQELATKEELGYFYEHMISELDERNFFKADGKREVMTVKLRNIFERIDRLSASELNALRGVISCLAKEKR